MDAEEILLVAPAPVAPGRRGSFGAAPAATSLAMLLPALAQGLRIKLLSEAPESLESPVPTGVEVVGPEAYASSAALQALPHVYELGDRPWHAFALRLARRGGGLLVLNHLSLHGLVEAETLGVGDQAGYVAACTARAASPAPSSRVGAYEAWALRYAARRYR
jgi:hypothetical protein